MLFVALSTHCVACCSLEQSWLSSLPPWVLILRSLPEGRMTHLRTFDITGLCFLLLLNWLYFSSPISSSDIDECSHDNGGCQQVCENEPGAYLCGCELGFQLAADGYTCVGQSHIYCISKLHVCWSDSYTLYKKFTCALVSLIYTVQASYTCVGQSHIYYISKFHVLWSVSYMLYKPVIRALVSLIYTI